jgi:hypothetical protein
MRTDLAAILLMQAVSQQLDGPDIRAIAESQGRAFKFSQDASRGYLCCDWGTTRTRLVEEGVYSMIGQKTFDQMIDRAQAKAGDLG